MIAVTPVLHEIIPHGWTRFMLLAPDATPTGGYGENPEIAVILRERLWTFAKDPSSPASLTFGPAFRAVGIGWLLHLQGRGWLESRHYREIEAPLDSCWISDAMLADGGRSLAAVNLTRRAAHAPLRWTMFSALTGCGPGSRTHSGGLILVVRARRMRHQSARQEHRCEAV
jgi:hypothetical protein